MELEPRLGRLLILLEDHRKALTAQVVDEEGAGVHATAQGMTGEGDEGQAVRLAGADPLAVHGLVVEAEQALGVVEVRGEEMGESGRGECGEGGLRSRERNPMSRHAQGNISIQGGETSGRGGWVLVQGVGSDGWGVVADTLSVATGTLCGLHRHPLCGK